MRTDRLRLLDAIEQIDLIAGFSLRGREAFFNDLIVQSAVLHRLTLLARPAVAYPSNCAKLTRRSPVAGRS